jgi:hypothetical protein
MTINAIETHYKGYRFRSRLEARWAVFFDALGYEWQYEPEGFEKVHYVYEPDEERMIGLMLSHPELISACADLDAGLLRDEEMKTAFVRLIDNHRAGLPSTMLDMEIVYRGDERALCRVDIAEKQAAELFANEAEESMADVIKDIKGYRNAVTLAKDKALRYLPDFYLPKSETWIEVKGSDEQLEKAEAFLEEFLDYGSPLPGFDNSYGKRKYRLTHGLVILGEVPCPDFGLNLHTIIQHEKGLHYSHMYFDPAEPVVLSLDEHELLELIAGVGEPKLTTKATFVPCKRGWPKVHDAYRAARSARFEHGENGGVK